MMRFAAAAAATAALAHAAAGQDCYALGERAQGAPGQEAVAWKRCCDAGAQQVEDASLGWGKFCLAAMKQQTAPAVGGDDGGDGGNGGEKTVYPDQARLYGISFSPFGLGSDVTCPPFEEKPGDSMCLSAEKARSDMSIIRMYTKRIKTYSLFCEDATVAALQFARETGMTVMLGIWIQKDETSNDAEIEKLGRVMAEYGDVVSHIMVGNEPVFILEVPEARVAQYITQVKGINNALPDGKRADGGVGTGTTS